MKLTARCPIQYVCDIDNEGIFLVVIAQNPVQKFYLTRSIEKQAEFYPEFREYYKFNIPVYTGDTDDLQYAIYPYFENTTYPNQFNDSPLKKIEAYYTKFCKTYKVTGKIKTRYCLNGRGGLRTTNHFKVLLSPPYTDV
jgi:hypothetical protein